MSLHLFSSVKRTRFLSICVFVLCNLLFLPAFSQIQPPTPLPQAAILIKSPTSGSIETSPLSLNAQLKCSPGNALTIELLDKQGKLLYRELSFPGCQPDGYIDISRTIFFDILSNPRSRLVLGLIDIEDVTRAVSSTEIELSSSMEIAGGNPDHQANFIVLSPVESSVVTGGKFHVTGWARSSSTSPIIIELLSASGGLLNSRQFSVPGDPGNEYFYFAETIPYTVLAIRDAILVIRQTGSTIPGNIALESFTYQVSP